MVTDKRNLNLVLLYIVSRPGTEGGKNGIFQPLFFAAAVPFTEMVFSEQQTLKTIFAFSLPSFFVVSMLMIPIFSHHSFSYYALCAMVLAGEKFYLSLKFAHKGVRKICP